MNEWFSERKKPKLLILGKKRREMGKEEKGGFGGEGEGQSPTTVVDTQPRSIGPFLPSRVVFGSNLALIEEMNEWVYGGGGSGGREQGFRAFRGK